MKSKTCVLGFATAVLSWPSLAAETSALPDFSGVIWGRDWPFLEEPPSGPGPVIGKPRKFDAPIAGDDTNPILRPEAAAMVKKRAEQAFADEPHANPHNQCFPEPTPFIVSIEGGMQILQEKDKITLLYVGGHKVRHVHMNVPHPANVTPTWLGHSVGHYEGDTLVIDTIGQKVGPLSAVDKYGTPHSEALHVIERYRLIDGDAARAAVRKHESAYFPPGMSNPITNQDGRGSFDPTAKKGLQVEITVEDPVTFTTPWKALVTYRPATGEWPEVLCVENTYDYYEKKSTPVPQDDKPDF